MWQRMYKVYTCYLTRWTRWAPCYPGQSNKPFICFECELFGEHFPLLCTWYGPIEAPHQPVVGDHLAWKCSIDWWFTLFYQNNPSEDDCDHLFHWRNFMTIFELWLGNMGGPYLGDIQDWHQTGSTVDWQIFLGWRIYCSAS